MNPVSRRATPANPCRASYHLPVTTPRAMSSSNSTRKAGLALGLGLGLALALGGVATLLAWRAAQRQRVALEEAVRSQIGLMADAVGNSIQAELWLGVRTVLRATSQEAQKGRLPLPDSLTRSAFGAAVGPGLIRLSPERYFVIDPAQSRWMVSGPALDSAGQAARTSLMYRRLGNPPRLSPDRFAYSVLESAAERKFVVFAPIDGGKRFIGFELPVAQLSDAVFDEVLRSHRRSVPSSASADSLPLALRVSSPDGAVLYQTSPAPAGPFLASAQMSGSLSSLVEVSLPQSDLALLVRGGLPGSPGAWLLAGLIGYSILLLAIGLATWRALALARLRTDFAGTVSHELRTPLTQVLLYAETLQRDQPLSPDQRRSALEAIVRETRRLVQMVENVLTVSLVGRPTPRLVYQPEEIETLVNEVLAGFAPAFRQRRVHPVVSVEGPLLARCDGNAVRQILRNLVDNALRYGPEREALTILAKQDDGRLELVVEDAGPGVPAPERGKIWEPFVRLDGTPGRGTGIGLSVVRQLAELHGGSARVENGSRGGARFVIDLALQPAGSEA